METMDLEYPENRKPLNFKEWALYIFLSGLPLIGLILLLVWAFNDSGNIHRKEWAKGMLLIYLILIIFWMLILFAFGGLAFMNGAFDGF
ncbi:MAG TPA: hypothetical protein VFM82_10105 [Flavobacteriaceae bacterium]|nr:hypothetical protein [Flavobacteriaceae bacterium]